MMPVCPSCQEPMRVAEVTAPEVTGDFPMCEVQYECGPDQTCVSRRFYGDNVGDAINRAIEAGWWPMPAAFMEYMAAQTVAVDETDTEMDAQAAAYDRAVQGTVEAIQRIAKITGDVANLTDLGHALNPDEAARAVRGVLASLLRLQDRLEQEKEGEQA